MTAHQLRAVTFNIHCGINQEEDAYSLERIGRSAMAADPHLLCIQEVERSDAEGQRTRKWSWSHSDDQVARLAGITGLRHTLWAPALHRVSFSPSKSGDMRPEGDRSDEGLEEEVLDRGGQGDYGVAILSALPFEETRLLSFTIPTPPSSDTVIYMDREQQPRGAAAARIRPEGGPPTWIVTTHLSHKSGTEEQRRQAQELCAWCEELRAEEGAAVILCGHMNSSPQSAKPGAWSVVAESGWQDAWVLAHGDGAEAEGLTCPSQNPRSRIDQFFV